jgi:uncharacterized protein
LNATSASGRRTFCRVKSSIDKGVVIVTGASSGIGRAFAERIAPRASVLVLVARRKDRLDALKDELLARCPDLRVLVEECDVTHRGAVDAMLERVERDGGPVDVLVNNAGFGDLGVFDRADWNKTERMIDLNVTSLLYLTHRLVRGMVERGRGGILNVSSGFGLTFLPGLATYIGTKHFVSGFTEALRLDLAGTGVVVTQVCPGPVKTEFNDTVGNFTGMNVPSIVEISADRCARAGIAAFDRRRPLVVPGILIWILISLGTMTPRFLLRLVYWPVARMLRKTQLQRGGAEAPTR